ncbi:hypothetical protein CLU79DRAFT_757233 [Phycomyces nitens]|nr:hypothetical protein CLU79DRAFT_757233 [Phycomyces nitens]
MSSPEQDDPYNARIEKTGCAEENEILQLCFYDKKDWRLCKEEMQRFRTCFQNNQQNAGSKALARSEKNEKKH